MLTSEERPSYRSQALLSTGIMTGSDKAGYVRDLVINELEGIQNLARSFETREELAARLLATYLTLEGPDPSIISERAYLDLREELSADILRRHGGYSTAQEAYERIVAHRDSLLQFGEANAEHPLIEILYGDNELVGIEHLAELKVGRRGLSDILEISYATVDAAWCKRTLDTHIEIFLATHGAVKVERSTGALAYFRKATREARQQLEAAEERLRTYSADNRIINYYEQTRAMATQRKEVDQANTEQLMRAAAATRAIASLDARLADRVNLVKLNKIVDDRRKEIAELGRQEARLEIMTPDSVKSKRPAAAEVSARLAELRSELSADVVKLQAVYQGPEGLELSRLLNEWIAATLEREESQAKVEVIAQAQRDFDRAYENLAYTGSTLTKIEREVHIAEEDYLENLRNLNDALQREHAQASSTDLRLVDEPILPTTPERSKRIIMVAAGVLIGGAFPVILAIALELLSGALGSFAEAERRSGLAVVGGVARWSTLRRVLRKRYHPHLTATTGDLLWQGIRSKAETTTPTSGPYFLAVSSLQPGAGKSYSINILAGRLAARGYRVAIVAESLPEPTISSPNLYVATANTLGAIAGAQPWEIAGFRQNEWDEFQVVLWELPAVATGRLPVDMARRADSVLLVHPPNHGWTNSHTAATTLLTDAAGQKPMLVLNGVAADILLNEWGASWGQLAAWAQPIANPTQRNTPTPIPPAPPTQATIPSLRTLQQPAVDPAQDWSLALSVPPVTTEPESKPAPVANPASEPSQPHDASSWETELHL